MFDIGFWELFLIFLLLLFVVGPERLPAIAGYLGKWFGKLQRYFFELKDSIKQEAEEPTKQINKILDDQKSSLDFLQKEIDDKKKDDEK
jgi:sec-independent protein translocase protein TatB|tara:strand:+ start:1514 stop:1780 length:267 start_codon:yes stop_codon:yes gene_type:complete